MRTARDEKPTTEPIATAMIDRNRRVRSSPRWSMSDMTDVVAGRRPAAVGRAGSGVDGHAA